MRLDEERNIPRRNTILRLALEYGTPFRNAMMLAREPGETQRPSRAKHRIESKKRAADTPLKAGVLAKTSVNLRLPADFPRPASNSFACRQTVIFLL
jgi:hypothetical protein